MDLLPTGTSVAGNYTITGVLGRGGMAVVYEVMNHRLGTPCALKVLGLTARSVRERLGREGRVQSQLQHPNILAVFDIVDVDGAPGLLMELVRGPSLEHVLQDSVLTWEQVDDLASGIFAGLAAAHGAGLIHRDLKPANILCAVTDGRLVPKIADFGLAKVLSEDSGAANMSTTRSGTTMGTPSYMAPEQIRNAAKVDQRADLFSLGAILYELTTGRKAFGGEDILEVYTAVAAGKYVPVSEIRPGVPERMTLAIRGLLEPDRDLRIRDCATLRLVWEGERDEWTTDLDPTHTSGGPWDPSYLARFTMSGHERSVSFPPSPPTATWLATRADEPAVVSVSPSGSIDKSSVSVVAGGFLFLVGAGVLGGSAILVVLLIGLAWFNRAPEKEFVRVEVPVIQEVIREVQVPAPVDIEQPPEPAPEEAVALRPRPHEAPVVVAPVPVVPVVAPEPIVAVVVPEPVAPEPVQPEPAPRRAGMVAVALAGDVPSVWLQDAHGNHPLPAEVPPGTYQIQAFFDGDPVVVGDVEVIAGRDRTLSCSKSLRKCR